MSAKLKVFTFNLRVRTENDGINCFDFRKGRVLEAITDHMPDLIGFQECTAGMRDWLRDALADDYTVLGCGREADLSGESAAVAFRKDAFSLVSMDTFWLSATPDVPGSRYGEDQSPCPRTATALLLRHRDGAAPFLFINTHLDHMGSIARLLGSVQILQYVSAKKYPVILTGDFNATPDAREIRVITGNEVLGIADATALLGGTFHDYGRIPVAERVKIDYVFSNLPADPAEAFVLPDEPVEGVYISDHYPVCAFVDVP